MTDGVGELHFTALGEACCHDVLGYPAAHIGGAAVYLGGILAGEGTTAVTAHAAVGVHDDLAAGEAGVALRAADHEFAGRVDEELGVLGEHVLWQHLLDDLLDAELLDFGVLNAGGMLGGDHHVDDAGGLAIHILHGDLALGVGAQPLGGLACLADLGQLAAQAVSVHDRRWHQLGRFVAGIAKHQALVACALFGGLLALGLLGVHTLGDVGGLGGDDVHHEELVGVEDVVAVDIADLTDGIADDLHVVELRLGGDLAANNGNVALHIRFAGYAAVLVLREAGVENGVGNGVSNFVGMAFADGLRGEDVALGHVGSVYIDKW